MRTKPAPQAVAWMDALRTTKIYVCSATEAKLLLGVALLPAGKRRSQLTSQVQSLFAMYFHQRCLPFDSPAAAHYAQIVAHR